MLLFADKMDMLQRKGVIGGLATAKNVDDSGLLV